MIKDGGSMSGEAFTMQNALLLKKALRKRKASLSIDEKIKIVEDLREKVKPIRRAREISSSRLRND